MLFENVKKILAEKGISVVKFEDAIGLQRGGFYKWKNHSPSVEIVKKASKFLKEPIDKLMK